jgi:hypothetical protein
MRPLSLLSTAPMLAGASLICTPAYAAEDDRFAAGVRGTITAADGVPANDIPGFGLLAHYRMNERWTLGAAIDRTEYDFEEPAKHAGITPDPALDPIDALAESTALSAWIERTFPQREDRWIWFVGAGVGAASVDVPDAEGPTAGGGRFDVHTEVDTEIILSALGGVRRNFGERWFVEFGLRADQHFADWKVTDRVSGATGSVGDYLAMGGYLAISVRW